jgi:diguanylate cyclase (GGDEF)-like protein
MREFVSAFGMFKVKLYDTGRRIVYSTDPSIIGMVDAGNVRLEQVLRLGAVDAQLVMKDKIADLQGRERFQADVVETYVPVREKGEIIGVFEVYVDVTPAREALDTALQLSLSVLLGVLAAVFGALYVPMRQGTMRLAEVQDQLREMASTDMLTGLANRRQLVSRIGEEFARLERARRSGEPLEAPSFIMADIDSFKRINDTHGHAAGDEALRQVAACLKGLLRPYDVIGRFGGEEFLVMLPATGLAEAGRVAERMRQKVEESPIDIGGRELRLTVSFGVARARDGQDASEAAIHRADEGLYAAKSAGRNRVVTVD